MPEACSVPAAEDEPGPERFARRGIRGGRPGFRSPRDGAAAPDRPREREAVSVALSGVHAPVRKRWPEGGR